MVIDRIRRDIHQRRDHLLAEVKMLRDALVAPDPANPEAAGPRVRSEHVAPGISSPNGAWEIAIARQAAPDVRS
ncbi:MAG: hypothetical protein ACLP50_32525 [Solirubrobacteraceae bacterium]